MITQTMMTIYNSISNLGALNIGSVTCVVLIDQLAIRPILGVILLAAFNVMLRRSSENVENIEGSNEVHVQNNMKVFELGVFKNLCE